MADLLRGDYKQSEYGKVILPLTVLRRLDCVLGPTKAKVLARHEQLRGKVDNVEPVLCSTSGEQFFNTSPLDMRRLLDDPAQIAGNLRAYIGGFSSGAREVLDKFDSTPRSPVSPGPTCCTSFCRSSPRPTCTRRARLRPTAHRGPRPHRRGVDAGRR